MRHFLSVFFAICTFLLPVSIRAAVTDYTLQPSAQAPINALTTFTIKFPEAKFLGMYGSNLHGVTLTNVDDPAEVYVPAKTTYSASFPVTMWRNRIRAVPLTTKNFSTLVWCQWLPFTIPGFVTLTEI